MNITGADESHIDEILAIDRECISPPWTEGQMLSEIYNEDTDFRLAVEAGKVLGFCVLRRIGDEAELLRIAVKPESRRLGAGIQLMNAAIKDAGGRGVLTIFLEVRVSNLAAISMYEKLGFRNLGVRRGYYDAPVEDAKIMSLHLSLRTKNDSAGG